MKHRQQAPTPELVAEVRIEVLEKLAHDLSVSVVKVGIERDAQAAIIRRNNAEIDQLRQLLSRCAPVLDTGTPGVEATR